MWHLLYDREADDHYDSPQKTEFAYLASGASPGKALHKAHGSPHPAAHAPRVAGLGPTGSEKEEQQ